MVDRGTSAGGLALPDAASAPCTPSAENGSLSLTAIDAVTRQIGEALRDKTGEHTVVYRSTVLPASRSTASSARIAR